MQRAFFPPAYRDSEITPQLKPGDKRTWTALQVFIELREETSVYIPFREASKVIPYPILRVDHSQYIEGLAMGWRHINTTTAPKKRISRYQRSCWRSFIH